MAAEGGGVFRLRHVPRGDTGGFEDGQGPGRSYGSRQRCRPLRGERAAGHMASGSPGQPRSPARRSAEPGSGRRGRPRRERLRLDVSLRWTAALATVPEAGRRGRGGQLEGVSAASRGRRLRGAEDGDGP